MKALPGNVKECVLCGFPFLPSRSDGAYCTPACRQRARRVRAGTLTKAHAEKLARDERAAFSRACVFGPKPAAQNGRKTPARPKKR